MKALGYGTQAQRKSLDVVSIKEAMRTEVVTTTPDTPLAEAARVMLSRKIGCLVVIDGNKIAGILTEGDFVKLHAAG
jgi:CBS domain-containing protein